MYINPKLINCPVLIEQNYLNSMLSMSVKDLESKIEKKTGVFSSKKTDYITKNNNAIIQIMGPLSQRLDFWTWLFGGSAYDFISNNFQEALVDDDIDTIIFEIDSPGGTVSGLFDLVDEISSARGKKKIIAVLNESAYSAAYGIASAADEIYIPRTGGAGSIGVIAIHTDLSKWEEKVGVKYTAIYAGARKNDFTPHEPLSDEAYKVVKAEVDDIYNIFVNTVAKNRGLDPQFIKNMEAGIYQGQKAVDNRLVDGILTLNEVLNKGGKRMSKSLFEAISETIKDAKPKDLKKTMDELGYVEKEGMMAEDDHNKAMDSQAKEFETKQAEAVKAAKEEGREEARKEAIAILEFCSIGGCEKLGLELVSKNVSLEDAKKQILDARVTTQTINSTVNPLHSGELNPIIAEAKKRKDEDDRRKKEGR